MNKFSGLVLVSIFALNALACTQETAKGQDHVIYVEREAPTPPPATTVVVQMPAGPVPAPVAEAPQAPAQPSEPSSAKKGCATSNYTWGERVLLVCANELAVTNVSGGGFIQLASFTFANYHGTWVNSIKQVCVKSIGPTSLDTVHQLNFAVPGSYQGPVVKTAPWPADGKVCADIEITVGAESIEELVVSAIVYPAPVGAQFKFEIEQPSDITISGETAEPIVGDFPVTSDMVTVVH